MTPVSSILSHIFYPFIIISDEKLKSGSWIQQWSYCRGQNQGTILMVQMLYELTYKLQNQFLLAIRFSKIGLVSHLSVCVHTEFSQAWNRIFSQVYKHNFKPFLVASPPNFRLTELNLQNPEIWPEP